MKNDVTNNFIEEHYFFKWKDSITLCDCLDLIIYSRHQNPVFEIFYDNEQDKLFLNILKGDTLILKDDYDIFFGEEVRDEFTRLGKNNSLVKCLKEHRIIGDGKSYNDRF